MVNLKLVHTLWNYRVLGTSAVPIFLSNDHLPRVNAMLDFIYGTSRPARSKSKGTKCKMKNSCSQLDSNPQPWNLKSDALSTELIRLRWNLDYLNDIYIYMYCQYQCRHLRQTHDLCAKENTLLRISESCWVCRPFVFENKWPAGIRDLAELSSE